MGNRLSGSDILELRPHLQGFEPESLSRVIWDAIKQVGVDDKYEGFGIHFEADSVTFWDSDGLEQLPRLAFLQILELIAKTTLENYNQLYDIKKSSPTLQLELALDNLSKEIRQLESTRDPEDIYSSLDSIPTSASAHHSNRCSVVELIRVRRGSCAWFTAEENEEAKSTQHGSTKGLEGGRSMTSTSSFGERRGLRKSPSKDDPRGSSTSPQFLTVERQWRDASDYPHRNKGSDRSRRNSLVGIEGIVERMPELRSRYEKSLNSPVDDRLGRVRNKMQSLTFLFSPVKRNNTNEGTWASAVEMSSDYQ